MRLSIVDKRTTCPCHAAVGPANNLIIQDNEITISLRTGTSLCYSSVILKPILPIIDLIMTKKKEIIVYAVSIILKAALLAATWAGKSRKRGLESIAKLSIDEKDKEIFFLRDRIYQLETQIKIFQKQIQSSSNKYRYTLNERLFVLWHMEYFQTPPRSKTDGQQGKDKTP